MNNYYNLLNVAYTANNTEIKQAYIKELKKYHPDIFNGNKKYAESIAMELNIAYATLTKTPESRLAYDHTIFPQCYSINYYYDNQGNRVPIIKNVTQTLTENQYDNLPFFSFFHKSKFSEYFKFNKTLTPKDRERRKKNYEEKIIAVKKQKIENKQQKLNKISTSTEVEFKKAKKKLDIAIGIISIILIGIIVMIIALNVIHIQ